MIFISNRFQKEANTSRPHLFYWSDLSMLYVFVFHNTWQRNQCARKYVSLVWPLVTDCNRSSTLGIIDVTREETIWIGSHFCFVLLYLGYTKVSKHSDYWNLYIFSSDFLLLSDTRVSSFRTGWHNSQWPMRSHELPWHLKWQKFLPCCMLPQAQWVVDVPGVIQSVKLPALCNLIDRSQ